jgi:protein-disulfide isomerase
MKRYLPFLIIIAVALVAAGAATLLYRAKMKEQVAPANAAADVSAEDQEGVSLHAQGPANAPVKLEIYGDFQCPACATASASISELQKDYGPRLRVIFHEFPLAMHAHAVEAAMAAESAGLQGHFWEMHDLLYKYQSVWSKVSQPQRFFTAYARTLGLDLEGFDEASKSPELKAKIKAEGDAGVGRGVRNTPTIFIDGKEVRGAFDKAALKSAIDEALTKKKKH